MTWRGTDSSFITGRPSTAPHPPSRHPLAREVLDQLVLGGGVPGYYALTLAELENWHLPEAWRKKLPRRIPGTRLGRLAVDQRCQGEKLGELLLVDALARAERIYAEAGGIGLFVDAIDEQAAGYYLRFGFRMVPDDPLLLFFPAGRADR